MKIKNDSAQSFCSFRSSVLALITLTLFLMHHAPCRGHGQKSEKAYESTYVGSLACKDCHPEEYENFVAYAKKSVSFQSIEKRMKHLTAEEIRQCYPCHTTGYGRPSGFVNLEETPHLKNAGCEVCHGPGAEHVKTGDPVTIKGDMTLKDCEVCHISERVKAFKYKPLIHGGAH
jgi:hypothetical protein